MPYKVLTRACGHREKVWLLEDEMNDPRALKAHREEICLKCYKARTPVREVEMEYRSYKIEFSDCRIKPGSYDAVRKTVVVYVPAGRLTLGG